MRRLLPFREALVLKPRLPDRSSLRSYPINPFAFFVSSPMTCFTVCPGTCFTVFTRLRCPEASVRQLLSSGFLGPVLAAGCDSNRPKLVAQPAPVAPTLRLAPWRFSSGRRKRRDCHGYPPSTLGLRSDTPSAEDGDRNCARFYATRWPEFACPGPRADAHGCAPSEKRPARAAVLSAARSGPTAPVPGRRENVLLCLASEDGESRSSAAGCPASSAIPSIASRPSAPARSTTGCRDPSASPRARHNRQRPSPVARAPTRRAHSTPPATPAGSGCDHPTRTTDRRPRSSLSDF